MIGFGVAGLCRRILVWPASLIWPQNLMLCTLLNTLHAEDDEGEGGGISRFRYFLYVFVAAFCWYFLPGESGPDCSSEGLPDQKDFCRLSLSGAFGVLVGMLDCT
jgi:hypothetical protein